MENAIEVIAKATPNFIVLGDFNRRLDEELDAAPSASEVREDKSDPVSPNVVGANGRPTTRYLWQEISDGNPTLKQIKLQPNAECKGFVGLDHILVSQALWHRQNPEPTSVKIALASAIGQKIETSDHCPRITHLTF